MFLVGLFIVPSAEFIFFASDSLTCAASIVRARYYSNQIQSDCFEHTLKFLLLIKLPNMSKYISYIFHIFLSSKKTRNEKFQNKKEIPLSSPLSHLFNSPLHSDPPPPPRRA